MAFGKKFKDWINIEDEEEVEEYLEIEPVKDKAAFMVRSFILREFEDVKAVIKALRTGRYIVLVDLKPLRENDVIDLRRAVNKLKAVNAEIAGDIAGLSGDWIVITPHPIKIDKPKPVLPQEREEEEI
jgi:SepF-like predicted cell division protein (DUF552 family)